MKEEEQLPAQTRHSAVRTDQTQFKEHVCFIDLNTSATHEHSSAVMVLLSGRGRPVITAASAGGFKSSTVQVLSNSEPINHLSYKKSMNTDRQLDGCTEELPTELLG